MNYKKSNLYLGWLVFLISTIVYFITIEDTVSLWDCGEYITAAYKLEVGHPPGAPLFMVLGRLFSFFADPENVAVWINRLSALSSSLTILFMFWSMTLLLKKIALKGRNNVAALATGDQVAILGAAFIGSLAYSFSESFWFSAVEGEVYAMSSLFTAIIFWAILKWDEEMMSIQYEGLSSNLSPDRWLLLIMFMLGLAIGVHLLGILVVPAIAYIIYFRYKKKISVAGFFGVGVLGVFILGFIQEGVIPGTISLASSFEVAFVNSLGMPFYTGSIFFFFLLVAACVFLIRWARKKGRRIVYSSVMGLLLLLIGYGSFAVIVIRSNANPPLDENDPENLVTLHAYLKREQYGSAPLLFGPYWNSKENTPDLYDDLSPLYLRRFVVTKGGQEVKAFVQEEDANAYAKTISGSEVVEMYHESNANTRHNAVATYAQTTFFPRMYWSQEAPRIAGYKDWSGYDPTVDEGTEKGKDGNRLPTFGENMTFFFRYQVDWMYWRYFMWNFAGRQNDFQGHGDALRGNWLTGFNFIDETRLGAQGDNAPYFTSENPSNNKFYLLPLILGIIGFIFHVYKAPKDAFVVLLAYLFTGVAIIVYLNQKPFEPRERDYAFAASFYFFAMWIGLGVYALYDAYKSFGKKELVRMAIVAVGGSLITLAMDANSPVSVPTTLSWLVICALGGGAIVAMMGLRKVSNNNMHGALVSVLLTLIVPIIMGMQGWDDHDRSNKTTAHNVALNYLNSCPENGIIFTNGDNDTFPLWYMQEVEGKRVDVRVCNLSLMQTDWYTNQMKMKAYTSDPLPIKFTEDQIQMYSGNTDQVLFFDLIELFLRGVDKNTLLSIIDMRAKASPDQLKVAVDNLNAQAGPLVASAVASDQRAAGRLNDIKAKFALPLPERNVANAVYDKYQMATELLSAARGGFVKMSDNALQKFQSLVFDFEKTWNYANLSDAMEFTRDEANLITITGTSMGDRQIRIFPASGFVYPVNIENAVKSGVILESQKDDCVKEIRFNFDERGLTREQVMMMDIIANNNWERGISFSSPGGSDVSIALYRRGHVKQNGMVFELSPLGNPNDRFNDEKMFDNLMKNYDYGTMSDPNVLTDYYARRHTDQYRLHFLALAEEYVTKALRAEEQNAQIDAIMSSGRPMEGVPAKMDQKQIDAYKKKAKDLIHHSLKVMPAEFIFDYGEPNLSGDPRDGYSINGKELRAYTDGVLQDYVSVLYMVGDIEGAEKLGMTVADQMESIFRYYENSNVAIVTQLKNTDHLYAALDGYLKMMSSAHEFGKEDSKLVARMRKQVDHLYGTTFPTMKNKLKELANNRGESTRRGSNAGAVAQMLFSLEDYTDAIAISFQLMEAAPMEMEPSGSDGQMPSPEMMQQLMNNN